MAELFEEVVEVLESRPSTRSLAGQFRITSETTAGNGAVLAVPVFIADLCRRAADPTQSVGILKTLRTIDTTALADMAQTVESRRYEPTGSDLTDMLLGDRRSQVASVISGEIGISERSANCVLPPAAWVLMASIAERYGSQIDRQSLLAILAKEQGDLVKAGWGPWLEATGSATTDSGRESTYPLPVSRSARFGSEPSRPATMAAVGSSVAERRPAATVDSVRDTGQTASASTAASVTGSLDRRDFDLDNTDFFDTELPEPGRSPLMAILATLLVLGTVGAAAYWFLLRDDQVGDTAQSVGGALSTDTTAENGDAEVQAVPATAQDLEPAAIDLVMRDPEAQSTATGIAELRFNPDAGEVCYNITVQEMGTPFDGHINIGPAGINGPVLVDFGSLQNADIGCTAVGPIEMAAILADPSGHYVEIKDPSQAFTIRGQLSDVVDGGTDLSSGPVFDPLGDGAGATVEAGRIVLSGEVADQQTLDLLAAEYGDLENQGLEVVNTMTVAGGAPAPSGQISIASTGLFEIGGAVLSESGLDSIDTMVFILNARPDWNVTIIGHTDATGDEALNQTLSVQRAEAVRQALVDGGVVGTNLQTLGAGSSDPVADNSTDEGRAQNRRIEFQIVR